jgi:hypothetical protein
MRFRSFSPNGNFFNNWLAIVYSLPTGFYLHSIYGNNRKDIDLISPTKA